MINWIKHLFIRDYGLIGGVPRSPKWPEVEKAFRRLHPFCEVCGTNKKINIHHCQPFHLNPELELSFDNLWTLCRPHHLLFGHFMDWKSFNPRVREDSKAWNTNIKSRQ